MLSSRRRVSMPQQRMNRNCQGTHAPRSPGVVFGLSA